MHFHALHEFFGDLYDDLEGKADDLAERIRSLGFFSSGSMKLWGKARLQESGNMGGDAKKMLEVLLTDYETVIQIIRNDQDVVMEKYEDEPNDFLIGFMEDFEKTAWMLRSFVKSIDQHNWA